MNCYLLSYGNFCMAYHLVVERVAALQTVDDFSLFVVAHSRNHCYSLVNVGIEVGIAGIYCFDTL